MLLVPTFIETSHIPNAGKGLFTKGPILKCKTVMIPNDKNILYPQQELAKFSLESIEQQSSVRWFEDIYTVDPEFSSESHLNHSFDPNLLWHLGFAFARRDIKAGEELTIDYSHLLGENDSLDIRDSITGKMITGISFQKKMVKSAFELLALFQ
jgi:hypothetical protein